MELNKANEDWEKEAPALAALGKENPFTVPDDYFTDLHVHLSSIARLDRLKQDNGGFQTPEGYFENLAEQTASLTKIGNMSEITADSGFGVPEGYFSHLQQAINSKTVHAEIKEEKGIRKLILPGVRYAAAACIVIAAATILFFNIKTNSIESKLSGIPEDEIVNYLQVHSDTGDTPVIMDNLGASTASYKGTDLSDQEIEQYLETTL